MPSLENSQLHTQPTTLTHIRLTPHLVGFHSSRHWLGWDLNNWISLLTVEFECQRKRGNSIQHSQQHAPWKLSELYILYESIFYDVSLFFFFFFTLIFDGCIWSLYPDCDISYTCFHFCHFCHMATNYLVILDCFDL